MLERPNPSSQENPKTSAFERLTKNLQKKILIGALSIASIVGAEKYVVKYTEYNSAKTFNEAFKKAHAKGEHTFYWNGHRYTTKLVDREFSKTYWESKKFLTDYYNSDYFKSKHKYVPSFSDKLEGKDKYIKILQNNPRYKFLEDKLNRREDMTAAEIEEHFKMFDEIIKAEIEEPTDPIYQKILESIIKNKSREDQVATERIKNLNTTTYFSITDQKGDMAKDGGYKTKSGAIYLYGGQPKERETTPVHELAHKSTKANSGMESMDFASLETNAIESIKKNGIRVPNSYSEGQTSEWIEYMTSPTEIDARQNSTRFWLFKHFSGYKADTVFTGEHYDFLQQNYSELPYDIKQLLDLFPEREMFIENMNKY